MNSRRISSQILTPQMYSKKCRNIKFPTFISNCQRLLKTLQIQLFLQQRKENSKSQIVLTKHISLLITDRSGNKDDVLDPVKKESKAASVINCGSSLKIKSTV